MAQPLIVGMTPDIVVESNFVIRFVALDPATGAEVSGVKFDGGAILATDLNAGGELPTVKNTAVLLPGPATR